MMTRHIILIILSLTFHACTTSPSLPEEVTTTVTACSQTLQVHLAGKEIADSAPNPFHGLRNPEVIVQGEKLKITLNTEESGLIELSELDAKSLQVGTIEASQFQLTLSYSPKYKKCTSNQNSKLMIVEKSNETVSGCLYGKFDCDAQMLEITAPFSEKVSSQ